MRKVICNFILFGKKRIKRLPIEPFLEKETSKKSCFPSHKGYILLEAIVSIGIISTGLFVHQTIQLDLLKASQEQKQEITMLRILYEEVRENRLYPEKIGGRLIQRNGSYQLNFPVAPYHQGKIIADQMSWEIYREN